MSYLALYRKYRPTDFSNLLGQEHIVKTLINQIETNRLGHAYLFTGTRGTGKTSAAKIFAKAINCLHPVNGSPCGECEVCKALSDASNIDVVEIDAASNNGVNEIRDLREKVQYPPVSCKYKVYIIDEVHMLTGAAFNALLKTLEEPPEHAVFILATTEVHKIPATILSRCMRFDFRLIPTETIASLIEKIYKEQGKEFEKEAVYAIAKAGEGSIRDALSIADTAISYGKGKLTYEQVMDILGTSNFDVLYQLVKSIIVQDAGLVLEKIDELCSLGKSMGVLVKDVTAMIRDLIIIKTCSNPNRILSLPETKFEELKKLVELTSEERLLRILDVFSSAENSLRYSNHPRVIFETVAVKSTRPDSDFDITALLSRIKSLEDKISSGDIAIKSNEKKQDKTVENVNNIGIKNLSDLSIEEIKGILLSGLRKSGSEMLWNLMQTLSVSVEGNSLVFTASSSSDKDIMSSKINQDRIRECFNGINLSEIKVDLSEKEKKLDEVEEAADNVKKIFGDDIVIID